MAAGELARHLAAIATQRQASAAAAMPTATMECLVRGQVVQGHGVFLPESCRKPWFLGGKGGRGSQPAASS